MQAIFWFIDDWIGSSQRRAMDHVEQAGYFLLLCHAAKSQDGGLPSSDYDLASLSELGPLWNEYPAGSSITRGERIRRCFFEQDGRLFNRRLLDEFQRREEFSRSQRPKINQRWSRQRKAYQGIDSGIAPVSAEVDAEKYPQDPKPQIPDLRFQNEDESTCASRDERRRKSSAKARMPDPQQEWFAEFWTVYMLMRNRWRADAAKALRQVCKTEATFQEIMAALKRQAPSLMERDPQHRPYAGRWLRSLAWKDDPNEGSVGQPARQSATEAVLSGLFESEQNAN